jgi:hypothetical protein
MNSQLIFSRVRDPAEHQLNSPVRLSVRLKQCELLTEFHKFLYLEVVTKMSIYTEPS